MILRWLPDALRDEIVIWERMRNVRSSASETLASETGVAFDRLALFALCLGGFLVTMGFLMAFLVVPPVGGASVGEAAVVGEVVVANKLLLSQKIFYFHMPVALVSFGALALAAYSSARFLATRDARFDLRAKVAMEIALLFVIMTMVTGEMWTRFEWGVWWTWEPRLTTYLILMLIVVAYMVLRSMIDEPERRATSAAIIGIVAFVDVPICLMVTRLIPTSVHPVVLREGGLSFEMAACVVVVALGMMAVAFALYRMRLGQIALEQRVDRAKELLGDR